MEPLTYIGISAVNGILNGIVNGLMGIWKSDMETKHRVTELNMKAGLDRQMMRESKELDYEYRKYFEERKYEQDERMLRLSKDIDLKNGARLQLINHSLRKAEIDHNFEKQLELIDRQDTKEMWPLQIAIGKAVIVKPASDRSPIPVNLFIMQHEGFMDLTLQNEINLELENFFGFTGFGLNSSNPVIGRFGAWKPQNCITRENVNLLWDVMKGIPTIVLRPVFTDYGRTLEYKLYIWGNNSSPYLSEETILSVPYDISSDEKKRQLLRNIVPVLACYTGAFCDCYHLIENGVMPQTPAALRKKFASFVIPQSLFNLYRMALYGITKINYLDDYTPVAYLNVARGIGELDNPYAMQTTEQLIKESVAVWENAYNDGTKMIIVPQFILTARNQVETLAQNLSGSEDPYPGAFRNLLDDLELNKPQNPDESDFPSLPDYEEVKPLKYGYLYVLYKGKWGALNSSGKLIVPFKYEKAWQMLQLTPTSKGGKWGFKNSLNEIVIDCIFDEAEKFYDCFARVRLGQKWGYIDFSGELIVPCLFDESQIFKEGFAKVCIDKKWGMINTGGETVLPFRYTWSMEVPSAPAE